MTDRALPNLPSRDLDATEEFYRRFGFIRAFRDQGWLILQRGPLQIEFFPFADLDPWTSSFMCTVRVGDLDELWTSMEVAGVPVARRGIPRLAPIERQPWGQRAGHLIDLDGTQLTLIEDAGRPDPA